MRTATGHPVKVFGKVEIHLRLGRLEFNHQVLVTDVVDEAILGVDVMDAYGFIVDFKNNVLRIGGEEVMLSTMTTAEKSMDVINQVAVTVPPNSEKIIMVRTEVDTRGNKGSIFEPQVVSTPGILIARSLVKPDETGNVPIRVANILNQAITLQSNTLLGKLTPVAWVAGITQQRFSSSDNSKLPEDCLLYTSRCV